MEAEASELNEAQLRANRYELVSRLADDLAHEIKNPLNAIIINLEVLKVRVSRADAQAALDRADVIEHEVRRLHHLVDRVLLLMRPGRDEPQLPLDSVLDELLPLVEAQTRLARNEFRSTCDAAVFVAVGRDTLKFALLNVLVATHDHLGEGGGTLSLRCVAADTDVRIIVDAIHTSARPPDSPGDVRLERAIFTADSLLVGCGARIERRDHGVSIVLPRFVGT